MTKIIKQFYLFVGDKHNVALLLILILAAYLRLWDISQFFNVFHDADEGVYAMIGRLISTGYIPYKDFVMVHPPFYELALGALYKIFDYNFLYGRYFSAALSLTTVIIAYMIGRKMYHPTAGFAAAAFFAIYPEMVYWGRSLTQESLGIFLIVLSIFMAFNVTGKTGKYRLFLSGTLLGLAVATKYTFIPAVFGVAAGAIVVNSGEHLRDAIQPLTKASLWIVYVSLLAVVITLIAVFKYALGWAVTVPFIEVGAQSLLNSVGLPLILTFIFMVSLLVVHGLTFTWELAARVWHACSKSPVIWLTGGLFTGFLVVTGFFWIKMPQDFIHQTLSMQTQQGFYFPSLPALLTNALMPSGYVATGSYFILLAVAAAIFLLRKRTFHPADFFLLSSMLITMLVCQWYGAIARYYVSMFPFLLLAIASFTPPTDSSILKSNLSSLNLMFKIKLAATSSMLVLFLGLSTILIIKNPVYDTRISLYSSDESRVYTDTINYLEAVGARRICAPNQIFPALTPKFESSLNVDYYAFRLLDPQTPEKIIQDEIDQGADFIILDYWSRFWQDAWTRQMREATYSHSRLVTLIDAASVLHTEIYWLKAPEGIMNGKFEKWAYNGNFNTPFGWLPMISSRDNEKAILEQKEVLGIKCACLKVVADSTENANSSFTRLLQYALFPQGEITIRAIPVQSTQIVGTDIIGPSVQFFDNNGHTLAVGFSDQIEKEESAIFGEGQKMLVLARSDPTQWKDYTFNIKSYWVEAGWALPPTAGIYISESTAVPGDVAFYISEIVEN